MEPAEQTPDPGWVPHRWRYLVPGYGSDAQLHLNFSNGGNDTAEAFEAWARKTYQPQFPALAPASLAENAQPASRSSNSTASCRRCSAKRRRSRCRQSGGPADE